MNAPLVAGATVPSSCTGCRRPFVPLGFAGVVRQTACSLACADARRTAVDETFPQRLKRLRTARRMTQQALADRLGATDKAVSLWELGKRTPSAQTLGVLAHVFGRSMDYLWLGPAKRRGAS